MSYRVTDKNGKRVYLYDTITNFRGEEYLFRGVSRGPEDSRGKSCLILAQKNEDVFPSEYYDKVFDLTVEEVKTDG